MSASAKPVWIPTSYSAILSGRMNRDTVPEMLLRKQLFAMGLRYRLNRKVAFRTKADLVFPRARLAVFVDGCFWHGCPRHGRTVFQGPNAVTWQLKLQRNKERDVRARRAAEAN